MTRNQLTRALIALTIAIAWTSVALGQAPPIESQAGATDAEKKAAEARIKRAQIRKERREKAKQAREDRAKGKDKPGADDKAEAKTKAAAKEKPVAKVAAKEEKPDGELPVPDPPGANDTPPPTTTDAIVKAATTQYKPKGGGHEVKFNLEDADLAELVNHISGLTGKRFIYGAKVRAVKVTVVSPTPVTLDEAYEAFLSILNANGMTVVPHGRFLKIVDSGGVIANGTPVYSRATPIPDSDRFITRLYRVVNIPTEDVVTVLNKFKSKEGDVSAYAAGNLIIMTDTGANILRMIRIIEEIDIGTPGSKMWIQPVHYGSAEEIAKQLNEIFEVGKPGGGASGLDRVIGDELTNSLVVVGTEESYGKLLNLLRRVDVAPSANGRVHVLPLEHAVAEEIASTLSQMLSGAAPAKKGAGAQAGVGNAAGMFEAEVRVTADKATNSLVVTSTQRDYAQLRLVITKLDQPRRQVFVEAVIMDVNVNRTNSFSLGYHGGAQEQLFTSDPSTILAGFNPAQSIAPDLASINALAVGVRGPDLEGTQNLPGLPAGISIPAFGVFINALATSGDSNVLSTPHIIATDNIQASIRVGQNIPLQTNFGGSGANLASLAGAAGGTGNTNVVGLGGLGLGFAGGFNAPRQDVGTTIKFTPHINHNNEVRLEIEEEISEQGATDGTLGVVSIIQRQANTTVVVQDQQTVVIGGLMRDAEREEATKIPVLGDLPVLGVLFRSTSTATAKTNLLLILTPYVIEDQSDLRKIFERKMQERQDFLDRFFLFNSDWEPPNDFARANGLVESIRQAYLAIEENERLAEERMPDTPPEHTTTEPIELPISVKTGGAPAPKAAPKAAPAPKAPAKRPAAKKRGDLSPIRINPIARSVNVERVE